MAEIHVSAVVSREAVIGEGSVIGPYSVIEGPVRLGAGVRIGPHAFIEGKTEIGEGSRVYPFVSLGAAPQHLSETGEDCSLVIGAHTIIRENTSVHRGTGEGGGVTRIGSHCMLMANAHVGHDCRVGDRVVMANSAGLAGHCHVGDYANFGGLSACRQAVHIGSHAFVTGLSGVVSDVLPYMTADGKPACLTGVNIGGLLKRGFSRERVHALRRAVAGLFEGGRSWEERAAFLEGLAEGNKDIEVLAAFLRGRKGHRMSGLRRGGVDE